MPLQSILRRLRPAKPIVVVSGLPRSGTSMMMRMLEAGGLEVVSDNIREQDEDNPRGYFEQERIKKLAKEEDKSWLAEARGKTIKVISFLLKDLPQDFEYKVIFMQRYLDEVLASQAKMLDRRGEKNEISDEDMKSAFEKHLRDVAGLCRDAKNIEVLDVQYDKVIRDAPAYATRVNAFLGGGLDEDAMAAAVEEGLYRNRKAES